MCTLLITLMDSDNRNIMVSRKEDNKTVTDRIRHLMLKFKNCLRGGQMARAKFKMFDLRQSNCYH